MVEYEPPASTTTAASTSSDSSFVSDQSRNKGRIFFIKNMEDSKEVNKFLSSLDESNIKYNMKYYYYADAYDPNALIVISF